MLKREIIELHKSCYSAINQDHQVQLASRSKISEQHQPMVVYSSPLAFIHYFIDMLN